jgi:hypothetical protein
MKRSLVVFALLVLPAGTALAAPGDPRVIQGSLEWPSTLSAEPFVVVRGDDGRLYYVDISAAQRRVPGTLTAGTQLAALGVEGMRPYEMAAIAFGAGDAASLGFPAPGSASMPSASIPSTTSIPSTAVTPGPPPEPMWRLDGTVQSVSGSMVTLRTDDERAQTVDMSELSPITLRALRSGDRVSLFGVPRADRKLIANGFIQADAPPPAASPPSTR